MRDPGGKSASHLRMLLATVLVSIGLVGLGTIRVVVHGAGPEGAGATQAVPAK